MLSGCVTSGTSVPPIIDLPSPGAAGDLFRKVPKPPLQRGDDARAKLAEAFAVIDKANGRIVGSCRFQDAQRRHYNPKAQPFDCDRPPVD